MIKKYWYILVSIVLVVILVIGLVFPSLYKNYAQKFSKYSGQGIVSKPQEALIFVVPIGQGRPKFDYPQNKSAYTSDLYDVYDIPAQEKIEYIVAQFQGWENISDSFDKYLIVTDDAFSSSQKYRVAFENSSLFGENPTTYFVENLKISNIIKKEKIEKPNSSSLIEVGFSEFSKLIDKGDTLILLPVIEPPEWQKKDENNNASFLFQLSSSGCKIQQYLV